MIDIFGENCSIVVPSMVWIWFVMCPKVSDVENLVLSMATLKGEGTFRRGVQIIGNSAWKAIKVVLQAVGPPRLPVSLNVLPSLQTVVHHDNMMHFGVHVRCSIMLFGLLAPQTII